MKIDRVIELQAATTDDIYLHLMGGFYHTYGFGAEAVAETMGYQVRPKPTKTNPQNCECAFPIEALGNVKRKFDLFRLERLHTIRQEVITPL